MRKYEFTVICYTDNERFEFAKQLLTKEFEEAQVEITKEEDLGVRQLAYPIKKEEEAHYLYYELNVDPAKVALIESHLRLSTHILKYLFVRPE